MTMPFFQGLTLGGILTSGSHGTGDRTNSALVDAIVSVTLVAADGSVSTVSRAEPEAWAAINGGLGLTGVITELLVQLTPPTNTQLHTVLNHDDANMYEMIQELLKVCACLRMYACKRAAVCVCARVRFGCSNLPAAGQRSSSL